MGPWSRRALQVARPGDSRGILESVDAKIGKHTVVDLLTRLNDREDGFTERKLAGAKGAELRRTIVAFANSVPEDRSAILFIGVSDSGEIIGVPDTDSLQKTVARICERECYPRVNFQSEVLVVGDRAVVAVTIACSPERPHFSGPAFVRRGSESVVASSDVFDDLIASRHDKARHILRHRGKDVTITARGGPLGDRSLSHDKLYLATHRARVQECNAHTLRLHDITTNTVISVPLECVQVAYDEKRQQLELVVTHP